MYAALRFREKLPALSAVVKEFAVLPKSKVDRAFLALSGLALFPPIIGLLFMTNNLPAWLEFRQQRGQQPPRAAKSTTPHLPHTSAAKPPAPPPPDTPAATSPPPPPAKTGAPPNASQKTSEPAKPVALDALLRQIAPLWPSASAHGSLNHFMANGIVRIAIYSPNDLPAPSRDFWTLICADATTHCVILLPNSPTPTAEAKNVAVVFLDDQTAATMPQSSFALVYDRYGHCAYARQYGDLAQMQSELRLVMPEVLAASVPLAPSPFGPVTPSGPTSVVTESNPATAPIHHEKPADTTALHHQPAGPNLASLDAGLQPLFADGRTSLLKLDAIRKARSGSKPVVLCFWATYCKACVVELGELSEMRAEHPEAVFIGLLQDSSMEEIRQMARNMVPAAFPAHYILSDALLQKQIFRATEIPLPAFAVFDGHGHMRDAFFGSLVADPKNRQRLLAQLPAKE